MDSYRDNLDSWFTRVLAKVLWWLVYEVALPVLREGLPMAKKVVERLDEAGGWQDFTVLPKPDQYGNYWFGKPGAGESCAIFPVKGHPRLSGKFFVSLGSQGVLFKRFDDKLVPPQLETFSNPHDALEAIQVELGKVTR